MTPRHFQAVWKLHQDAEERWDNRFIMLAVSTYNAFGAKKQDGSPITSADFKTPHSNGANGQQETYGTQTTEQKIAMSLAFRESWLATRGKTNG